MWKLVTGYWWKCIFQTLWLKGKCIGPVASPDEGSDKSTPGTQYKPRITERKEFGSKDLERPPLWGNLRSKCNLNQQIRRGLTWKRSCGREVNFPNASRNGFKYTIVWLEGKDDMAFFQKENVGIGQSETRQDEEKEGLLYF